MAQLSDNNLLEFETAMKDFQAMFPNASRERIEQTLRENDGDVSSTIDQLLADLNTTANHISEPVQQLSLPITQQKRTQSHDLADTYQQAHLANAALLRSSASISSSPPPSTLKTRRYSDRLNATEIKRERQIIKNRIAYNEQRLDTVCDETEARMLEDEQIALMLQNREFIKYLQRDQEFMRGIHPSRRHSSAVRKSSRKYYLSETVLQPAVPDGPIITSGLPSSSITQKIKSKFQTIGKSSSNPPPYSAQPSTSQEAFEQSVGHDNFPYTVTLGYPAQQDSEFMMRLKNMSKASKSRLTQLASLFKKERNHSLDGPVISGPRSVSNRTQSLDGPSMAPPPYSPHKDYCY